MRIGIDTLAVVPGQRAFGGGARFLYHLLQLLPTVDVRNEYILFVSPENAEWVRSAAPSTRVAWCPGIASLARRVLWEQFVLPWQAALQGVDVMYFPINIGAIMTPRPMVLTIHDLAPFFYRSNFREGLSRPKGTLQRLLLRASALRATAIMTDSEFVKQEIVSRLRVTTGKIHVVHLGVTAFSEPDKQSEQQLLAKLGIQTEYILAVGTFHRHKNFDQLVRAFHIVRKRLPERPLSLVLVGRRAPGQPHAYENVWSEVKTLGLVPHTIFASAISDTELGVLYRGAAAFVLPSLYEGFGFPVLEAMLYGVPVVVSNAGSLPELVDNHGVLCDPYSSQSIANAIERVLVDQDLRRRLTTGGIKRAREFSWESTARRVVKILEATASHRSFHLGQDNIT